MANLHTPLQSMQFRRLGGLAQVWEVPRVGGRRHKGWDLLADVGTAVYAVETGEIAYTNYDEDGYGHYVVLKFQSDLGERYALYAHLSQISVSSGPVNRGDVLGRTGISGNAKRKGGGPPHLHFEVRTAAYSGAEDPAILFGKPAS